jgi:hypothetical protein
MIEKLKAFWEAVDKAQKWWAAVAAIVAACLQAFGVRSGSMRLTLEVAVVSATILSYLFTVARYRGQEPKKASRARKRHVRLFWVFCFFVVALFLILEPNTARTMHMESVYAFLVSSAILPNLIGFISVFGAVYSLIGAIVLTSPHLSRA